MRTFWSRFRALFRSRRLDREFDDEIGAHLAMLEEECRRSGMSQSEATLAARRQFGGVAQIRETYRDQRGFPALETLLKDVRYALRGLRRDLGFTVTAVLTLAVGIGASAAVFTAVDSVVLKPLSYRDSGALVAIWERVRMLGPDPTGPNPRHWDIWRNRSASFSDLALARQSSGGLNLGAGRPVFVGTVVCTPNLLDMLGTAPALGHSFVAENGVKGRDRVAILSDSLWRTAFHADRNVVGKTIRLSDVPREVIGVLPQDFHFPNRNALRSFRSAQTAASVPEPAIFIPAAIDPNDYGWNSDYGNWVALARLKPGVAASRAEAELNSIEAEVLRQAPAAERDDRPGALLAYVQPMQEAVTGQTRTPLFFLMAAVAGLMLIACLNLANAQLGRALMRHREASIRAALGASKARLVWASLTENSLLALAGGAAGVGLAAAGLSLFRRYRPVDLPRLSEVHLNPTVLLFSVALTAGSVVLFGLLPALRLLHSDPHESLRQGNSRALGSRQSRRLRSALIAVQVFGCTVLLIATALFSKSLIYLLTQERGFETGRVAVAQVNLPSQTYGEDPSRVGFLEGVLENLRAVPGVQAAAFVSAMPLEGESWIEYMRRTNEPNENAPMINLRWVSPGYFETTRQRLVAGRFFEERDRGLASAVLSESEAKALWKDENPIGGQVVTEERKYTVIGVVADSRNASLKAPPPKMAYLHYKDRPPYSMVFMVRSSRTAAAPLSSVREAIWRQAPDVAIAQLKTLDDQLNESLASERFQALLLSGFAAAALLLAMLGIYGVLSYSVAGRRQEIGVRMALGATRLRIYALTTAQAFAPVAAGLAAGLLAGVFAARAARNLLFGVQPLDPAVMLAVASLFFAAAEAAAFFPARRAAALDPVEALRRD